MRAASRMAWATVILVGACTPTLQPEVPLAQNHAQDPAAQITLVGRAA